jgi:hypothetical protein
MPIIFEKNAGRVILIPDRSAEGLISLGNVDGATGRITYQTHKSIITRIGYSAAGNYQFLHTIGNDVYLYVFGDRMGTVELHGISFAEKCSEFEPRELTGETHTTVPQPSGSAHGFEEIIDWYKQSRVAAYRPPVTVTIGRETSFKGFVTGMSGDVQDTMRRTVNWRISVAILPDIFRTPGAS